MTLFDLAIYLLKFMIPALFSIAFRAFGLGYKSKLRVVLGFLIFILYMAIVPSSLINIMGYGEFTHVSSVIMFIGSLSILVFSTDSFGKTIFLQLIQSSVTTILSIILNMIRTILGLSYPMLLILLLIFSAILYWVALRYWAKPLRYMADLIQGSVTPYLVLSILIFVSVNLIPIYPLQNFANHPFFCTFMMLAIESCFLIYIYLLYHNLYTISFLSQGELKNELLQSEINSYKIFLDNAYQTRHDIRHHDTVLLAKLEEGNIEEAKAYLQSHVVTFNETSLKKFCNNSTVNIVLRIYENRSQEKNISFFAYVNIPSDIGLKDPEIGSLLGNLLENALNECVKEPEKNPYIKLTMELEKNQLLLEVRNSLFTNLIFRNGIPVSNKPNGGIGTRSITSTVKTYNGMISFSQNNDEFIARIIIPMNRY
ncbi:sensor histidine kinase [Anaerorhabdus sp.]|uniref:sensor histidine kinase n=1 Tax=Anaerorhabdus sp. TaxID=1872524 RepID=UPI002FCAD7BB